MQDPVIPWSLMAAVVAGAPLIPSREPPPPAPKSLPASSRRLPRTKGGPIHKRS